MLTRSRCSRRIIHRAHWLTINRAILLWSRKAAETPGRTDCTWARKGAFARVDLRLVRRLRGKEIKRFQNTTRRLGRGGRWSELRGLVDGLHLRRQGCGIHRWGYRRVVALRVAGICVLWNGGSRMELRGLVDWLQLGVERCSVHGGSCCCGRVCGVGLLSIGMGILVLLDRSSGGLAPGVVLEGRALRVVVCHGSR